METLSPESLAPKTEKEQLRDKLIGEESLKGTFFGSIIGAVPGFALYLLLLSGGAHPIITFFIPGIFVGFGARFLGRGIRDVHGRIAALVVLVALGAFWWYFEAPLIAVGFAVPNVLIALLLAPRKLTREEGAAVFDYRIGRWSPPDP